MNVQNQPQFKWPANFVVARAYIDQLNRSGALAPQSIAELSAAIAKVEASPSDRKAATQLNTMAAALDKAAAGAKTPADGARLRALSAIVKQNTAPGI